MRSSFLMGLRLAVLLGSLVLFTWAAVGGQGLGFVVVWLDGIGLAGLGDALSPIASADEQPANPPRKSAVAAQTPAPSGPTRPALWLDGPPAPPEPVSAVNPDAPVVLTPREESVVPPAAAPWSSPGPRSFMGPPTTPAVVTPAAPPAFAPGFRTSRVETAPPANPAAPAVSRVVVAAGSPEPAVATPVAYFPPAGSLAPLARAAGRPNAPEAAPAPPAGEGDALQALAGELQALGANFYRLERVGETDLFRCQCRVPLAGRPQVSRHFQATGESREAAMARVVDQVRQARAVRP